MLRSKFGLEKKFVIFSAHANSNIQAIIRAIYFRRPPYGLAAKNDCVPAYTLPPIDKSFQADKSTAGIAEHVTISFLYEVIKKNRKFEHIRSFSRKIVLCLQYLRFGNSSESLRLYAVHVIAIIAQ